MKKIIAIALTLVTLFAAVSSIAETQLIAIPNDGTNLSRGIKLLESAGLLEVDPAAGFTPEIADITNFIYDIDVVPVAANTLTATLEDYAASTINGTWATSYGLVPSKDGLIIEKQSEGAENPYVNIIVARTADAENETYKTIVDAFHTQLVAEYLLQEYNEAFFPAFDYSETFEYGDVCELVNSYESPKEGKTVVKIGVCGSQNNHWYAVQKVLDEQNAGIYIELVEFSAYDIPNDALNSGEIDLNSFQHKAYLGKEVAAKGYDIVTIGDTLIAPLTLYSKKVDSLDALKDLAGLAK